VPFARIRERTSDDPDATYSGQVPRRTAAVRSQSVTEFSGGIMRVVVVGATGVIGQRVVARLERQGVDVVPVARELGVNAYTGENLAGAMAGATTVVDVSNSSYVDEDGARDYFEGSTLNLLTYGRAAGVSHHLVLSIVGVDRLSGAEGGYFRAKWEQERLVTESRVPYTIVHATQFFEFMRSIADVAQRGDAVAVAHALVQPMAADDVADAVVEAILTPPVNGIVEWAGPRRDRLEVFVQERLAAGLDDREVEADPLARYFGTSFTDEMLLPGPDARIAPTQFRAWLDRGRGRPGHWAGEKDLSALRGDTLHPAVRKAVVFGGTGRIGSQVIEFLRAAGVEAVAAAPENGVDVVTGEGMDAALVGADVAVDAINAMIFDDSAVDFFRGATQNMLDAERRGGVSRHVALSIVGTERITATGYMAGKRAQEEAIRAGDVPYSIVRATQFLEFLPAIADGSEVDGRVVVPPVWLQPVAAREVARVLADVALDPRSPRIVEVAGPERATMAQFLRAARVDGDHRRIVEQQDARYVGCPVAVDDLVPIAPVRHGIITVQDVYGRALSSVETDEALSPAG
jgi:uncharacterized protein YbjT (DUF2867 family)